jgi:hypothetical protein
MPKRTLMDHRPWLLAAVIAAVAYFAVKDSALGGVYVMMIKGLGVGFLAIYALRNSQQVDSRILALYLALCALGDMGIELSLELGGALFAAAHLAAIVLFLSHPREHTSLSQKGLSAALIAGVPLVSWLLSGQWMVAAYGLVLGAMAACAWLSHFPRYRVGIGAILFVMSDFLIFAREGVLADSFVPQWFVWPLYFAGQVLIATGVIQTLRGEHKIQSDE